MIRPPPFSCVLLALLTSEVDVHVLFLRERDQLADPLLAAQPRLLVAAEGCAKKMAPDLVDPDEARLGTPRRAMRPGKVARLDRAGKA